MGSRDEVHQVDKELLSTFSLRPRMTRTPPPGAPGAPESAPPNVMATVFHFGADGSQDTPKRRKDATSPRTSLDTVTKKSKTQMSLVEVSEELGGFIDYLIANFKPKAVRLITQANRDAFVRMKELQIEISSRLLDRIPEPSVPEVDKSQSNDWETKVRHARTGSISPPGIQRSNASRCYTFLFFSHICTHI